MYRPPNWDEEYLAMPDYIKGSDGRKLYEAGADAMLTHIIELVKKIAPSSKLMDILNCVILK